MGQVPPPPYPPGPQPYPGSPKPKNYWVWIIVGVCLFGCVLIPIVAAVLFPVMSQARLAAKRAGCLSNSKLLATSMLIYAVDYDDTLPPREGWNSKIESILESADALHCPGAKSLSGYGYAYSEDVVGAKLADYKEPFKVPMIFESNMTLRDAVAKYEPSNFANRHRFKGKTQMSVAFLDSSAKMVDVLP